MTQNQSAIACRLEALTESQRQREQELLQFIRKAGREGKETTTGYAIRLPSNSSVVLQIAEFITLERLCCPFLSFELQVEAEGGPIWLRLTGREGVKEFLTGIFSRQA
jgi:hypothetical protein